LVFGSLGIPASQTNKAKALASVGQIQSAKVVPST
jgi:hypothetical protein